MDTYGTVFDAIIGSYKITPIEGTVTPPFQGVDSTEPSQRDQPNTATENDAIFETDYYALTIPASWDGRYAYEQDGNDLTFYELDSYNYRLNLSDRHYYRLRQQAVNILSIRLWTAPTGCLDAWLEVLTLLEDI